MQVSLWCGEVIELSMHSQAVGIPGLALRMCRWLGVTPMLLCVPPCPVRLAGARCQDMSLWCVWCVCGWLGINKLAAGIVQYHGQRPFRTTATQKSKSKFGKPKHGKEVNRKLCLDRRGWAIAAYNSWLQSHKGTRGSGLGVLSDKICGYMDRISASVSYTWRDGISPWEWLLDSYKSR
jgi:hypothetical protein